ncbi:hypothetical protein Ddye_031705 [Dipteronia dyeriana]|uniref:Uncharacterized protein n=1 Tax=Dipteronia dyeriana TaxID=168575 RepID=A0AAD9TJE6_9ROSI|nr:hypothetical protein Ddye_031705 [Dipteronia dyeriana]
MKKKRTFHLSSFLARGATIAAGRLEAEQGILKIRKQTEDYPNSYNGSTSIRDANAVEVPTNSELPEPDVPKEVLEKLSTESLEVKQTQTKSNYERTLSGGLQSPRAEVPKKAILDRINPKKAVQSHLSGQLELAQGDAETWSHFQSRTCFQVPMKLNSLHISRFPNLKILNY